MNIQLASASHYRSHYRNYYRNYGLAIVATVMLMSWSSIAASELKPLDEIAPNQQIVLPPPESMGPNWISKEKFLDYSLLFVLMHELGHAAIDLYDIPILTAGEEDAADSFATWILQARPNNTGLQVASVGAEMWLANARVAKQHRHAPVFWGEHSPDERRGYRVACLVYGSDPVNYYALANRLNIPDNELPIWKEKCIREAQRSAASWQQLIDKAESRLGQHGYVHVNVMIEPPTNNKQKQVLAYYQQSGLLLQIQNFLRFFHASKPNHVVTLAVGACGQSNAFWDWQNDVMIICYELPDWINSTAQEAGIGPKAKTVEEILEGLDLVK